MSVIGQSLPRVDASTKVTGEARYPGDLNLPYQTYMKILFANRPHARIRNIDVTRAEMLPGVIAVFTAKDVPVNEYGLIMPDQPVLCGPGSTKPYTDHVRWIGDQVALVVAETEAIAEQGRDLIVVDYEDLLSFALVNLSLDWHPFVPKKSVQILFPYPTVTSHGSECGEMPFIDPIGNGFG